MKKLALILGVGMMLLATPLAGCADSLQAAAGNAVVSSTSTSPTQAHALGVAVNAYTIVANAATVYVKTAKPSSEIKAKIGDIDRQAYRALTEARAANAKGNSPAVAAAVAVVLSKAGELRSYLAGLGVPVPALPAL